MYAAVVHKKLDTKNLTRTGRPKKITAHGTRQLKNIVKSNRTKTLESLTNLFNSGKDDQVSSKTVARTLHSLGFRARKACRKPMISKKNLKKGWNFITNEPFGLGRFATDHSLPKAASQPVFARIWRIAPQRDNKNHI